MVTVKQYDVFKLTRDLNAVITIDMKGVILEIWNDNAFEVEFVKDDGTNYEYNDQSTFTIDKSFIGEIVWTSPT
jgi:hypothetical protein